jgi:hypothetical protein
MVLPVFSPGLLMTVCGAQGRRVVVQESYGGVHERLVRVTCTEDEHQGDQHYDGTYGLEFGPAHMAADS